ncbi:MAG: phosphopentomutase DeoB [Bacteroidetes bacterium HLUCCA01]|nr:MAG: phosphopentomutase DeoB [Bacteroidetes bacterium HLUCCA01]
MPKVVLIIVDGLGVGAQEDAHEYRDAGSNTAGHVSALTRCMLPNMEALGFGNIIPLDSVNPVRTPLAAWGKMREVSVGKDSTTGHWEIAGITLDRAFPVYPDGFPSDVVEEFCKKAGVEGILGNAPYSGTDVIDKFGVEHLKTGKPIVYTSADSVFQIATHTDCIPLDELYRLCQIARNEVMTGEHAVGRVIARPFAGDPGQFYRLSDQRHDYSLAPPYPNLPEYLLNEGVATYSVGKIIDLFAERGFSQYRRTKSNAEGIAQLLNVMQAVDDGFIFVNLIDTDQLFGHRNDPVGYGHSLEEFDRSLPAIQSKMGPDDVLIITGDHGNDPTFPGTDHTREFVPLLVYPAHRAVSVSLGVRSSFRDVAASVAAVFGKENPFEGVSFLSP